MAGKGYMPERYSIHRPPYFDGSNYCYWKNRMQVFLRAQDHEIWKVVNTGPHKLSEDETKWTEDEIKKSKLNFSAMNIMQCAINPDEYSRVSTCSSAMEMWNKLKLIYEGTSEVKETKANMLITDYDSLVMVSGGSGITSFFSIIRELIFRSAAGDSYPSTPTIHLICAFKTSADLTMLDLLLPISSDASGISRLRLHIDAFVTREKAAAADNGKHIRTIWFKPRPLDVPVSAALGPRSWLWLAAVISASIAAFLLLLGVLNRCYIYPIDKNTNKVYSYSARALLNLLLLYGCMGAAAAAAFLWNKRAAASSVDTRQVQSMDGTTLVASPGSWFYNVDRELGSIPQESLVRSTNVHFGTRPDLKKMLLELDCPNTGVLVSGPREMRREVASICSSGLAQNLHFESMSFSW